MQLEKILDQLVEAWCDERQLDWLRILLPAWPLHSAHTDGWGDLMVALRTIENSTALKADHRNAVHAAAECVTRLVHERLDRPQKGEQQD
jgi:hypothetical protein